MEQYPDSIVVTVETAATQDKDAGLWTEGSSTVHILACRAEVNGNGRKIPGKDGGLMDFSFICYLPLMTTVIPPDSEYVLTGLINGTISGKVKRANNGQLNSRIWL